MQDYTIARTGHPPLKFRGELVSEASSHRDEKGNEHRFRWHEVRLYRTESGKAVCEAAYISTWKEPAESGYGWAVACDWDKAPSAFEQHNPRDFVIGGYPPMERYVTQQARLIEILCRGYQIAVSSVLGQAGFAETVS